MLPVAEGAMAAFDYSKVAELFPGRSEAELLRPKRRRLRREPIGYGRFARAADAIRFAIEELPAELLPDARLEVGEKIFNHDGIFRLYESDTYPLVRRATTVHRTRAANPIINLRLIRAEGDTMKFRPLHDRVVVKRIDAEAKSAGGIIIPETAQEKPSQGKVTAVGPGGRDEAGKLIPIDLEVGDRVLFSKWSGTEVQIEGVDLLIMKESDIMGVLDELVAKGKAA
jgi:chaperonin GroES